MLILLASILVCTALAFGVHYVSYMPRFTIESVEIRGTKDLRKDVLEAYIDSILHDGSRSFISKSNIFLYPRASIEERIAQKFPRVERARITRDTFFSTGIVVSIKERTAYAKWCGAGGSCFLLDKPGLIFASSASTSVPQSSYVFSGGLSSSSPLIGQSFLPGKFAGLLAVLEKLAQNGFGPESVHIENDSDFSIRLSRDFKLRASFGANVEDLIRDLELVLASPSLRGKEHELEYIDLRFGNRVYYKLKGEAVSER